MPRLPPPSRRGSLVKSGFRCSTHPFAYCQGPVPLCQLLAYFTVYPNLIMKCPSTHFMMRQQDPTTMAVSLLRHMRALNSVLSLGHYCSAPTVIALLFKAAFTPSNHRNLGLPRICLPVLPVPVPFSSCAVHPFSLHV